MFKQLRITALALIPAAFAVCAIAQQAPVPAALTQAVAATLARKVEYSFDYALQSSKQNWHARYDLASPPPRLHMVAPRRDQLPGGEQHAFDNLALHMEGVSWCSSTGMARARNVRLVREDAASAVYAFQPTREAGRGGAAAQFMERLRGEFTLSKAEPDITAIRFNLPQPFSPIPLTRLDGVDIAIRCDAAPNGRRYVAETVTVLRGTALGQNFNERSVTQSSNLRTATP